ncbi:ligand-binding sensor domain-containing protein [Catalinimonas niigatensis]|uniref:ligand-binding sensor domain-containing protein n=1 Tax=Catalinimonas niigatensis TaxID=1397264 RepID=UPI00266510D7|nr:two-component regulator propeller domain-containing protein [Catalinimonas niigatensis]WPP49296.1 two-component regulator propeller domain-containing protein [Catalinimonas niigatensis]
MTNDPNTLSNNKVKTMLMDRKARVWIGLWNGGLDYFDQQKQTFTHIRKGKNKLTNDNVVCMAEDQDGYLWIGTFGGGLHKFNPDSLSFQYFHQDANSSKGISDSYIWSILVDRQNNVWVGTSNGYVDVWDRKTKKFTHLNIYETEEVNHAIKVIFEDSKGRIWIGSEGGGLKLLDKKNSNSQTVTTIHGLPSNNIEAIEEDKHGKLWISTNYGIVQFDPETTLHQNFIVSDGLQSLYFNRNASTSIASGEIMFGGINGFNMFHPDSISKSPDTVSIVFTNF